MGGAAARTVAIERGGDHLPDAIHVSEYVVIPESQNAKALTAYEVIATLVVGPGVSVLTAVDFNESNAFRQAKSAMYGPMRTCLRNL